jgi:hypothetical protein
MDFVSSSESFTRIELHALGLARLARFVGGAQGDPLSRARLAEVNGTYWLPRFAGVVVVVSYSFSPRNHGLYRTIKALLHAHRTVFICISWPRRRYRAGRALGIVSNTKMPGLHRRGPDMSRGGASPSKQCSRPLWAGQRVYRQRLRLSLAVYLISFWRVCLVWVAGHEF